MNDISGLRPAPTHAAAEPATKPPVRHAPFNRGDYHPEHMMDSGNVPEVELSFGDFLDLINPLQHIPVVGTIYRALTGDEISAPASIFGGFLFGGPIGFVAAIANAIFEEASGRDVGETALAALLGDETTPKVQTALAAGAGAKDAVLAAAAHPKSLQIPAAAESALAPTVRTAGTEPGPSETLTGARALAALVNDLGDTGRFVRTPPPNGKLGAVVAIQARAPDAMLGGPRAIALASPDTAFAQRMLAALDKYQAIARKDDRSGEQRTPRLDSRL